MTPLAPGAPTPEALVSTYGWNTTAVQALNPGMRLWRGENAVIGYAVGRRWPGGPRVWIGAGEPICPPEALQRSAEAFSRAAEASGASASWFGASERFRGLWSGGELVLGAQPVWTPSRWPSILAGKASLRAQVNRARNKGVSVTDLAPEDAERLDPVRRAWLHRQGLPPLHFLVESDVLESPGPRRFLVAERHGSPVGALVIAPVPARDGAFVEWIWQTRRAPNGTASLLLHRAFLLASGASMLTLGMVPLSSFAPLTESPPPRHIRGLLAWMRAHARRFYNFEGLERFKAKFQPDTWEPLYLLAPEARIGTGLLYAVADAFAGPDRSPEALIAAALARAVGDEASGALATLRQRLSRR